MRPRRFLLRGQNRDNLCVLVTSQPTHDVAWEKPLPPSSASRAKIPLGPFAHSFGATRIQCSASGTHALHSAQKGRSRHIRHFSALPLASRITLLHHDAGPDEKAGRAIGSNEEF